MGFYVLFCPFKFNTSKELNDHNREHLEEIEELDIEYLKHGNESFVCNMCEFNSNNVKKIKQHIINRVVQPNVSSDHYIDANEATENNASFIEEESEGNDKEIVKDWRGNYDDDGNPLNEDKDDDSTADTE